MLSVLCWRYFWMPTIVGNILVNVSVPLWAFLALHRQVSWFYDLRIFFGSGRIELELARSTNCPQFVQSGKILNFTQVLFQSIECSDFSVCSKNGILYYLLRLFCFTLFSASQCLFSRCGKMAKCLFCSTKMVQQWTYCVVCAISIWDDMMAWLKSNSTQC